MNIKPLTELDIVLTVFNQENLIERVLYGIFKNTTTPFNLIIVFDGCSDRTEPRAQKYIKKHASRNLREVIITHAPNVYETRANNIGYKLAKTDYLITVQDDMVVNEYAWERRLTYPLRKFDDILGVTARIAQDVVTMEGGHHVYSNRAGRELKPSLSRNIFAVRDVLNRGPIAFSVRHLKTMNYLNDAYAPSDLDDADISLRAWTQKKLRVGAYWINYLSPVHWGKARAADSTMEVGKSISRNALRLMADHGAYFATKIKHTEDVSIPETEVDYVSTRPYRLPSFIHRPIRITKKETLRLLKLWRVGLKNLGLSFLSLVGAKNVHERGFKKILTFKK